MASPERSDPGRAALPRALALVAYLASVPLANWALQHVGTGCRPDGPCLLPVGFGLRAPSGVVVVGFALVLRDLVQRTSGLWWSVLAMLAGTALSLTLAPPALVTASGSAFVLSELADLAVYTPLRRRGFVIAASASAAVGVAIDNAIFVRLAFGSFDHLAGQVIGKAWAVLAAVTIVALASTRDGTRASVGGTGRTPSHSDAMRE